MIKFTVRLTLFVLMTAGIALFPPHVSGGEVSEGPTLEGARVVPEEGPWGSTFTFEITYVSDNENDVPATGYPKIFLNGSPKSMVENDPTDGDVTDGKVYTYHWTTAKENVGSHTFYFYVETLSGKNARDPATGAHDGPLVRKRSLSLSCEVDDREPATGETITFSGYMRKTEENFGVAAKGVTLYKLLPDNEDNVGSATTDENGYFILRLHAPSPGIFFYSARSPGDNYFEASESPRLHVNTLDKPMVLGVYAIILLALVMGLMFLLSRGIAKENYLKPAMLGFFLGFFLLFAGAGFIGVLAAGGIAGYLSGREVRGWTKHLRIGWMTSFLFLLVSGLSFAFFLVQFPAVFLKYSVTQAEVFGILINTTIFSGIHYALVVGLGAVLGGMLRRPSRPPETKQHDSLKKS